MSTTEVPADDAARERHDPAAATGPAEPSDTSDLLEPLVPETPRVDPARLARHHVLGVLVTHDGSHWVERALRSALAQDRPLDALCVVDTGSTDDTLDIVRRVLADDDARGGVDVEIRTVSREHGFGTAVAAALADRPAGEGGAAPGESWLWLLHDDCAPEPGALGALLTAVDGRPSVAVAGPKLLGWADPRRLLEVGVTIARGGQRETGLERHEQDQGQHDAERGVLAVSTAGMLARRDVWDELGGLDPSMPVFRDDVDLGWRVNAAGHRVIVVPDAVVHHAEAATHRRRRIAAGPDQPHRVDRQNAMTVLVAHAPALLLPLVLLRLVLGTLGRVVGFLVAKDPGFALAELRALGSLLRRPAALRRARAIRASTRRVRHRDVSPLLAPRGAQLRRALDVVASVFSVRTTEVSRLGAGAATSDDDADDVDDFLSDADSALGRLLRRPGVVLVLAVLALALLAERMLVGAGVLAGGSLLPVPGGAADLWSAYAAPWSSIGVGSDVAAAGYLPVLAAASTVLLGKVWLLVDVLVLLAVPLAAASAYLASRQVVRSVVLRLWAAATYALLPAATGAVANGRVGTLVLLVVLPLAARPLLRVASVGGAPTWRTAWGVGLLLSLLVAFVPALWLLAAVLAGIAALTVATTRAARVRLLAAVLTPVALLVPWSLRLIGEPGLVLLEAGVPSTGLRDADPHPIGVLALAPGGAGTPAWWVGVGVVLAGLAALARRRRRRLVAVSLVVAAVSLALGALAASVAVGDDVVEHVVWPGPFVVVASAALLTAALVAARGARSELASSSFGWRQPVAVLVSVLCVLGTATAAVSWLARGADGPLERTSAEPLPAFVAADLVAPERPRAVVLRDEGRGLVSFVVVRDGGVRLGDAERIGEPPWSLGPLVSELASGQGDSASAQLLNRFGVRYVVLDAPLPRDLARNLDAATGLRRVSTNEAGAVWRVTGPSGRVRVVIPGKAPQLLGSDGALRVDVDLPEDTAAGRLQLAEPAHGAWRATLGGLPLTGGRDYGLQSFELPEGGGRLVVTLENPSRGRWLLLQAALLVVVVVLALPGRRRDGEGEDA